MYMSVTRYPDAYYISVYSALILMDTRLCIFLDTQTVLNVS